MKLVFVENRHKTYFYVPIVKELQKQGHEIHWLIQNREFVPKGFPNIYVIPYPKGEPKVVKKDQDIEEVMISDRQFNHFRRNNLDRYYYYYDAIENYLDQVKPDLVFGESTAFHELLAILYCKRKDILFLHPSTCRYPVGRFSFYEYDTLLPYQGSKEQLNKDEALEVINQIVYRTSIPDYMRLIPPSRMSRMQDRVLKIKSYAFGEKYNTPAPRAKYKLEKQKKRMISSWDAISEMHVEEVSGFSILYPLQMQPEANLDVWGKNFRDQAKLIKKISDVLPEGVQLIVKPNPKSNYEISNDLIELASQRDNIIPLHHQVKMDNVLSKIDLVMTVTGTIAIESILSDIPVATLVHTINNRIKSCIYINDLQTDLIPLIDLIKKDDFPITNEEDKIGFINLLNQSSYKGKISDPFTDVSCISEENVQNLVKAFESVLSKHDKH